ncbi:hypothetical protein YQE_01881, partial [Dendroctonus ponderosae]
MFLSKLSIFKIFLFFVCYSEMCLGACLDKFALASVDALVRSIPNSSAILMENVNFNSLDTFVSIDVVSSNISQLCTGMIKDFPVLKKLSLINANLSEIQPGIFEKVPSLEYLSLGVNQLDYVPRGVFDSVKSLKVVHLSSIYERSSGPWQFLPDVSSTTTVDIIKGDEAVGELISRAFRLRLVQLLDPLSYLCGSAVSHQESTEFHAVVIYLTSNRIRSIEDGAFALMPLLEKVYLAHNQIAQLTGNIFFGSTRLSLVDLSFNKLVAIEESNFEDLKLREGSPKHPIKILLQRNQIENVARETFLGLRPVLLHLEYNQISRISQIVSGVPNGSKVFVDGNRIECIPDDVLERVEDGLLQLWAQANPLTCECLKRVQELVNNDIKGQLNVSTTLPCDLFSSFF